MHVQPQSACKNQQIFFSFSLSLLPAVLTLMLRIGGDHKQLIEYFWAGNLQQGRGGGGTDLLCCCERKYLSVGSRCTLGSPSLCTFVLAPLVPFHLFFVLHTLKQLPMWLCSEGGNGWGRNEELANKGGAVREQRPLETVIWRVSWLTFSKIIVISILSFTEQP